MENSKDSTKELWELINELSKVAVYKINTHKSLAFLFTYNEKSEREINESIPFIHNKKRNTIPRNKLNQRGERLITKNCKLW